MGILIGADDPYIGGLLETLNLCFSDTADTSPLQAEPQLRTDEKQANLGSNGIREMVAIQAEFRIFDSNRPLVQSLRALGVGGLWNSQLKRKWFMLLNRLDDAASNIAGLTGGKAIADALAKHLQDPNPTPVHFKAHDSRTNPEVMILKNDRPLFYIEQEFLTISIPMRPRPPVATASTTP
jgi:hypothetical protein